MNNGFCRQNEILLITLNFRTVALRYMPPSQLR